MDKENLMPIVLGSSDRALLREFAKKYGIPVIILDRKCPFWLRFSPRFRFFEMKSDSDEIVSMYVKDLLDGTDRIPLLAADENYREMLARNAEELSSFCILWHEKFEF